MPLFNYVYNNTSSDQTAALYRYCPAFSTNMNWEKVLPFVEDAEAEYIKPVLGDEFYDELITALAGTPTAAQIAAIAVLRPAVAWFTFEKTLIGLALSVSEMGPAEAVDTEGRWLFPRKWVSEAGRQQAFRNGYKKLEEALRYLEKNEIEYSTWYKSAAYCKEVGLFIPNATILANYIPLDGGRAIYSRLRPAINKAELHYIKPVLGEALFNQMKNMLTTPASNFTIAQAELLDKIRLALAEWMLNYAVPFFRLKFNELGIIEPAMENGIGKESPATQEAVAGLWMSIQEAGKRFLLDLKTFLDSNADSFPNYTDTKTPAPEPSQEDDNGRTYNVVSFL
jgi:hypothetical protein